MGTKFLNCQKAEAATGPNPRPSAPLTNEVVKRSDCLIVEARGAQFFLLLKNSGARNGIGRGTKTPELRSPPERSELHVNLL
jgi:hypothetical protein